MPSFVSHAHSDHVGTMAGEAEQGQFGGKSPYLAKILRTHWIRTFLINGYAAILFAWTMRVIQ
jgi:hypothetical protein